MNRGHALQKVGGPDDTLPDRIIRPQSQAGFDRSIGEGDGEIEIPRWTPGFEGL